MLPSLKCSYLNGGCEQVNYNKGITVRFGGSQGAVGIINWVVAEREANRKVILMLNFLVEGGHTRNR